MDFKSNSDETFPEGKEKIWRNGLSLREYQSGPELNVGRNVYKKVHSGEVSDGNEDMLLDNEREDMLITKWQKFG